MSENINIKIKGIDPNRRPSVVNKNYIDIIFELSDKANKDWCVIFNDYFSKSANNIRINPEEGNFVETWVRDMEDIPDTLSLIQEHIGITNTKYSEKLIKDAELREDSYNKVQSVESERLESILSGLNFD
jgi:hypothetical protein